MVRSVTVIISRVLVILTCQMADDELTHFKLSGFCGIMERRVSHIVGRVLVTHIVQNEFANAEVPSHRGAVQRCITIATQHIS